MKLESALKHFSPKSQNFAATAPATGGDCLTGTDLMAALGYCQSKAQMGISAVLAKSGVSEADSIRTVEQLTRHALRTAPKLVRKAAGNRLGQCMVILSKLAFDEYSRTAASTAECPKCAGTGMTAAEEEVTLYPGHVNTMTGEVVIPARVKTELVERKCDSCGGKGQVSARCRCNGTGRVRDMEKSRLLGAPVDHECERCSGKGFRRTPGSKAYRAITAMLPELQERTWNNNWRRFYEALVAKCEQEESHADAVFQRITK